MTARERAEEVCRLFGIARRPEQDSGSAWGPNLCARIEKAILAAEAAAYERAAACVFDAICDGCGRELNVDRLRYRIRSLAKKGGEG